MIRERFSVSCSYIYLPKLVRLSLLTFLAMLRLWPMYIIIVQTERQKITSNRCTHGVFYIEMEPLLYYLGLTLTYWIILMWMFLIRYQIMKLLQCMWSVGYACFTSLYSVTQVQSRLDKVQITRLCIMLDWGLEVDIPPTIFGGGLSLIYP